MGNQVLRPPEDDPLKGFTDEQLTYLSDKFEIVRNEKGFLETDLLCDAYKCSKEQAERVLKYLDNEQTGNVDFYQFKCAAASLHQDDQEAERMIHEIFAQKGEIRPQSFGMLYKTIYSYLKDMNAIKEEFQDKISDAKFKQYDYSKNGFLDLKEFSEMLHSDYHCKAWMELLGFKKVEVTAQEKKEKPENDAEDFAEDDAVGDQAGSTPAWIKTIQYLAPSNPNIPKDQNQCPSNNLQINYVYGYRSYDTRDNLKYSPKGQVVYHTAALGIVLNQGKNTMRTFDLHNDDVTCLDVKDNLVVTGQMGQKPLIAVWDTQNMEKVFTMGSPLMNSISTVTISPSKKYIAATSMGDKHEIAIYNVETRSLVATGNGPRSVVFALKFTADEEMVAAACSKEVVFASFKNGKYKLEKGIFGKVPIMAAYSLARCGNGMVSGMHNGSILSWKGTSCMKPYKQHNSAVSALCETDKGGLISGDAQGQIVIWSNTFSVERKLSLVKMLVKTPSNNPKVIALCSKGSNLLIGTRGAEIIETSLSSNPATGTVVMEGHYDKELWGVASTTKSNQFFTGGQDKLLIKWDINKRKLSAKKKLEYEIMSVDYNGKTNTLAVGMKNGIVGFYQANTLKPIGSKIANHKNPDKEVLSILKYSPDCSILAVGYCPPVSKVYLYSTENNKKIGQCKNCLSRVTCIDFSLDGDSLMLNNTSYEILFFKTNGTQITTAKTFKLDNWNQEKWASMSCKFSWQAQGVWPHLYADGSNINSVQRSHSGKLLATGDDFSKIKLFKYPACVPKQFFNIYKGHSSHITGIKWSYNDQYMISIGGLQKSIIQWKVDAQEEINYEYKEQEHVEPEEEPIQQDGDYEFEGVPIAEVKEKKPKDDDDDDFEQDDNEGDQALAVKPFEGQVKYSTPSEYARPNDKLFNVLPAESLKLKYAWGIRNQYISDEVRNQLKYSEKGDSCVYFTAALGVELNFATAQQTFYNVQSEDLVSMSITNDRKIVATGQMAEVDPTNKKVPKVDIHIWEVEGKKPVKQLKGFHQRAIVVLEFSPDGTQLLSIGQDDKNSLAVYNWKAGKIVWTAPTSKGKATAACWKDNKEYCTVGNDHVKFWTEAKGTMGKVPGKWEPMCSVAFLEGSRYVSGGSSGSLFFWNGGSAFKIEAHSGKVHAVKFVQKSKTVYTGAEDGKILSWKYNGSQLSKQGQIASLDKVAPLCPGVLSIDMHPSQDRMLVCTKSSEIYQFPTAKFAENRCMMKAHYAGQLWCCSFSPSSDRFVTGGDDKTIRVYSVKDYKQHHMTQTSNIIRAVDWCKSKPELIVAGDWKGSIFLYNEKMDQLDQGRTRFNKMKPMHSTYWIQDIKFSPDGQYVAFGAHGGRSHIEVFKIDGKKFGKGMVLDVGFTSALLSLDWNVGSSIIASVSQAYELKFASVNSGDPKKADVSASSMKDQKWASWTNKFGWMVQGIFQQVEYFSIHGVVNDPNWNLIATGGTDQKVKIFKYPVLVPKQKYKEYIGHSSHITRVRFSEDEDYLLSTGGNDRTSLLWEVERPNKEKKAPKQLEQEKNKQEQEEDQNEKEKEDNQEKEDNENQTQTSKFNQHQDDIDIPGGEPKKEQKEQEQDDFAEDDNEGDQFMAVLPFKGALVAPTVDYYQSVGKPPKVKISLQYAYGYRAKDCRNNLRFLTDTTISYHTAALGITMDISSSPQQQTFFNKHTDDILSMCWSEDKSSIFTGQQGPQCPIHEWDAQGSLIKTYKGMIKGIVALACNHKYLAAAGMDDNHIVIVFDRKTGAKFATQKGGKEFIVALEFIDQNTFVSVGIKHQKLWTIEAGKLSAKKGTFKGNCDLLSSAKLKGNKILAGAGDGSLQIWQGTSIVQTVKNLHESKPLEAICCLENVVLTGGKDKKINILDSKFKVIKTIDCEKLLEGSVSPMVRAIDVLGSRLLIGTIASEIYQVECSTDVDQATSDSKFKLVKCRMSGHYAANAKWTNEVWGLSLMNRDDQFVTCSDDSTVRIWNLQTRQQVACQRLDMDLKGQPIPREKLTGDFQNKAKGRCVAVSEDKYILVGCKQGTVRVFDPSLKQVNIIQVTKFEISDIKFSADNSLIAIGAHDSKIYIYEWKGSGKMKKSCLMKGHHSTITHLDFSRDGNYLHSNSRDYELLFWDTSTGNQLTSGATMLRDEYFHTWTSCIGWTVEGIWQKFTKGTDINAVDRTKQPNPYQGKTLLCVGDDFGKVRLLEYPCRTKNSQSVDGSGHSSHVTCVRFDNSDERIISTGGEDQTIIQWKLER